MKKRTKLTICLGVICALLVAISSWYTIAFNNSRFIVPMDLSEYVFRVQDLPMIISGVLLTLYIVNIVVLFLESIKTNRLEMSRNVQSGNTQNLKSMVIQRSFPKWSVAERRKTAAASDQAAVCACAHSRYFAGGSPSGLRV